MAQEPYSSPIAGRRILPLVTLVLAIGIFALDVITPVEISVAVLYVLVVLIAGQFYRPRGVVLVSLGCAALAMSSHFLSPGDPWANLALLDRFLTLSALAISTVLVLKNQSAEDDLRRSEAYLVEAQRLSLTGSFSWNVSSGDIYWSEETFRIFGHDRTSKPTVEGVLRRTHPDDRALVQQVIDRAQQERTGFDFEHRLLMPDGSVKYLRVVAHASKNDADDIELVGALMDVTAARRAVHDLQKTQAELAHVNRVTTMGQLAASIAHEVNQPVAGVVTNADAALRWLGAQPPDLEEVRLALADIVKDGNRASEVISRIRGLISKVGPRKDRLDINQTIREVISLAQSEVVRNGVSLQTQLENGLPPIQGDRIQLQQVVLNLIVNAVEAMGGVSDGSRELLIGSGKDGSNGVLVAVRDSGPGLDPENSHHLFDAFYTTKPAGMGMGLSICRSIIEAHGGRVWASGNAGPGATFQFTLPLQYESAP